MQVKKDLLNAAAFETFKRANELGSWRCLRVATGPYPPDLNFCHGRAPAPGGGERAAQGDTDGDGRVQPAAPAKLGDEVCPSQQVYGGWRCHRPYLLLPSIFELDVRYTEACHLQQHYRHIETALQKVS